MYVCNVLGRLLEYYALNQTHKSCISAVMRAVYRAVGIVQFYTVTLPENNLLSEEGEEPYILYKIFGVFTALIIHNTHVCMHVISMYNHSFYFV